MGGKKVVEHASLVHGNMSVKNVRFVRLSINGSQKRKNKINLKSHLFGNHNNKKEG